MRHIGIYSGTFDPVHPGHLALADLAQEVESLDTVIFMPEPTPRSKPSVTDISIRVDQLKRILSDTNHEVYVSGTGQFCVDDTLEELHAQYPDTMFSFIIGSDVAKTLSTWPNIERLLSQHALVVGMRSRDDREEVEAALRAINATYAIVQTDFAHYASSQFRSHNTIS